VMFLGQIKALLEATTAYLRIWPILQLAGLYKQLDEIDDEIFALSLSNTNASQLRLELLNKRRKRIDRRIEFIRSSISEAN